MVAVKRILNKLSNAFIVALIGMLLMPSVALAQIANPDNFPSILKQVEVYRNCIELGDQLYLISYDIEYALPLPTERADEAWLCRLMSGAIELGSTTPYPFEDDGYAYGVMGIYFDAASAPAWMGAYTMRLEGNPTLTWAAGAPPRVTTAGFVLWYDGGSVIATQERLTTRMQTLAWLIELDWGAPADLVSETAAGKKLTASGEEYFVNAVPYLREMCPDLFSAVVETPQPTAKGLVQDNYIGSDNDENYLSSDNWTAQTFTATSSYALSGVELKIGRTGNPGTVTVSLRATTGDYPSGVDLVSGTISGNDFTDTADFGEWEEVSFSDTYDVTLGIKYAIVVRALTGNVANYARWRSDSTGTYTTGHALTSDDAGVNWGYPDAGDGNEDFLFIIKAQGAYTMSYREKLANRLVGTRFDMTIFAEGFNISRMWMSTIVWFALSMLIVVAVCRSAKTYKPATLVLVLLLPFGALLGFVDLVVAILAGMMCGAATVYVFFFARAP